MIIQSGKKASFSLYTYMYFSSSADKGTSKGLNGKFLECQINSKILFSSPWDVMS